MIDPERRAQLVLWRWERARVANALDRPMKRLILLLIGLVFTFAAGGPLGLVCAYFGGSGLAGWSWGTAGFSSASAGEFSLTHGVARRTVVHSRYRADMGLLFVAWLAISCAVGLNPFSPAWGDDDLLQRAAVWLLPAMLFAGALGYGVAARRVANPRGVLPVAITGFVTAAWLILWLPIREVAIEPARRLNAWILETPEHAAVVSAAVGALALLAHRSLTSQLVAFDPTPRQAPSRPLAPGAERLPAATRAPTLPQVPPGRAWIAWCKAFVAGYLRNTAPVIPGLAFLFLVGGSSSPGLILPMAWVLAPLAAIAFGIAAEGHARMTPSPLAKERGWEFALTRPITRQTVFGAYVGCVALTQLGLISGLGAIELAVGLITSAPLAVGVTLSRCALTLAAGLALGALAFPQELSPRGTTRCDRFVRRPLHVLVVTLGGCGAVALTILAATGSADAGGSPFFLSAGSLVIPAGLTLVICLRSSWIRVTRREVTG